MTHRRTILGSLIATAVVVAGMTVVTAAQAADAIGRPEIGDAIVLGV